jgi:hypothetical protein
MPGPRAHAARIRTGTTTLLRRANAWHTATDRTGTARLRAALARTLGTAALAWFLGGLWIAARIPAWDTVPGWLIAAWITGKRHDDENHSPTTEPAPPEPEEAGHEPAYITEEYGGGAALIIRDPADTTRHTSLRKEVTR